MTRVYVSSTALDLEKHRAAAIAALRRLGHEVVAMEDYTARSGVPAAECVRDVASCEVYVGLFAWRIGFVPSGGREGITELELAEAERSGKVVLAFLVAEDEPWPPAHIDEDKHAILALRARLMRDHVVEWFRTPDDLAARVATAVTRALQASGATDAGQRLPPERRQFLCQCIRRYLTELAVQSRASGAAGAVLVGAGAAGMVLGMALDVERALIIGAGGLVFFTSSAFPFTVLRSARNKRWLWEACVTDLEKPEPSPESVRFAQQLLARLGT